MFKWSNLGPKLYTSTDYTTVLGRYADGWIFEIRSWVGLSSMRCEGASVLRRRVIGKGVAEVVVLFRVLCDLIVILRWREIDGCPYASPSHLA